MANILVAPVLIGVFVKCIWFNLAEYRSLGLIVGG